MANIYDMVDTWNDGATTFTAIKMNATDTASDADSLLMDLQVGGVSQFSVDKGGICTASRFTVGGTVNVQANAVRINGANGTLNWTSGALANNTVDLSLARDAANTLAQRNGTNAQAFNLYNTFTDASNYERGFMKWDSNVLEIGTAAAGTGTDRYVRITSSLTNGILFAAGGSDKAQLSVNAFFPSTDSGITLGNATKAWGNAYISGSIIVFSSLPTADPVNAGQLWNDSGTLKISAG